MTITAINGSNLSLKTDDGWTRTIAVTSDTAITRAGTTIAVGDLKVGDEIAFRQDRQDDGTYTITEIHVVLPTVAGQVTKIDGSTITVQRMDGTTQVIHVDGSTTYRVNGVDEPDACRTSRSTRSSSPRAPSEPMARSMPTRWPAACGRGWDHDGDGPGMPGRQDPRRRLAERLAGTVDHPGLIRPWPERDAAVPPGSPRRRVLRRFSRAGA